MSKKLIAKVGTYQKNGEAKNEYDELGVVLSNDNGPYILIDPAVNLAGVLIKQNIMAANEGKPARTNVMVSIFDSERMQNQQQNQHQQQPQQGYQPQQNQQAPQAQMNQAQPMNNDFSDDVSF